MLHLPNLKNSIYDDIQHIVLRILYITCLYISNARMLECAFKRLNWLYLRI